MARAGRVRFRPNLHRRTRRNPEIPPTPTAPPRHVTTTQAANEAKDNSKFLSTLERFLEPLTSGTPEVIIDAIPALLNALKMVHTISRFFNTTERMTKLFMKITNQMIQSCSHAAREWLAATPWAGT